MKLTNDLKSKVYGIKAKAITKKGIILALAGAFVVTGIGITQVPQSVAMAATQNTNWHNRDVRSDFSPEVAAQDLQDTFGIDKQTILDYNTKGWRFRDLDRAAFISYASGKPFSDVLNAKTVTNSWRDVSDSFGITIEQGRKAQQTLMGSRLANSLDMDATTIKKLLGEGYHPNDIAMAAMLAKKTDKSFNDVLGMKKINNNWYDIAASLGISEQSFDEIRFDARNCMGYGNHRNNGYQGNHRGGWHNGPRY